MNESSYLNYLRQMNNQAFEVDLAVPNTSKENTKDMFRTSKILEEISPIPNVNRIKVLKKLTKNGNPFKVSIKYCIDRK